MSREISIAYTIHLATGEGYTLFIAVGGSASHAERIFRNNVPEYFQLGMTLAPLKRSEVGEVKQLEAMIPRPVLDILESIPLGSSEYFSRLHYNLS